ncbi:DUF885 domain-containing protein [Mucilaginibacter mali]|uniref:DUF885 domain-containing protein n=1 Tax=Mucilaginibacter mali TaxID=2740462 RepID=A0A7D4QBV7_9SPHI|nr:DUF885 domain-containing protein [Mucilaginibacter mali]QKJ31885.1 DUF885 domain-containing protein [Mucilaginibacter mali]
MKTFFYIVAICLLPFAGMAQQATFSQFADKFADGYQALRLPQLELSYVEGFKKIQPAANIQKQITFFEGIKTGLKAYNVNQLSPGQKLDYQLIAFETGMNLERLSLEKQWAANKPAEISDKGILSVPNGKAWYTYLLRRWLSADITPDQIYQFGLAEVKRVQQHIQAIQKQSGMGEDAFYKYLNSPGFFITDAKAVQDSFERVERIINGNMDKVFTPHQIPALKIERGSAEALAQTPGYYNSNTFYYNLFDKPYNRRQFDWLFIHEAVPGHHYQTRIDAAVKKSKIQALFDYIGFAEGWGAYAEELGKDLGVYQTPYAELGKWEWDIVRSVRVPMDIGLNYYGWTDEQALAFWKKNIKNQDDIAMREIARVKRWPAQCITYKYGAVQIMQWKQELQQKQGGKFNIRDFHNRVLNQGSLPLFLVRENVLRD